ncbi:hypothetical protein BD413DRAFT_573354 [Trametes elegans]|nr:hypothetical protein BD413DRAFT_573354 [Trametes elegans]
MPSTPLPPGSSYPLAEWERADKLNVEMIGYGWDEKRVMVRFNLPKDRDFDRMQLALALMGRDVKHSKNWQCEFCGAPARESHCQTMSRHHLNPPKLIIYMRFVCDMDERHVRQGLTATHNALNIVHEGRLGPMPSFESFGRRPEGVTYPLAGSCASCQREETAGEDGLKRCSRCKLTRYCSVECQRKDWARHKVACGAIYSATFENWG